MKELLFILFGFASLNALAVDVTKGTLQHNSALCNYGYNPDCGQSSSNPPKKIIKHTIIHLPSKYGAIAMNKQVAEIGGSENMDSKAAARRAAIQSCQNGNPNVACKIVATYENGCIAAVGGKKKKLVLFTAAHETSGGYALKKAMAKCEKYGASNCQVLISESCSLP